MQHKPHLKLFFSDIQWDNNINLFFYTISFFFGGGGFAGGGQPELFFLFVPFPFSLTSISSDVCVSSLSLSLSCSESDRSNLNNCFFFDIFEGDACGALVSKCQQSIVFNSLTVFPFLNSWSDPSDASIAPAYCSQFLNNVRATVRWVAVKNRAAPA